MLTPDPAFPDPPPGAAPSPGGTLLDAVVVGGGPAGSEAARVLAASGRSVLLLDRAGRIKPCGGAIPPRLLEEFALDEALLKARITAARVVSPRRRHALMPIADGFVGMVDREEFDEWLRVRAARAGAERRTGIFERVERDPDGTASVRFRDPDGITHRVRARVVVGADGARSAVALQCVRGAAAMPYVFAFHEIVRSPAANDDFDGSRCDVYYGADHSPDFYGWVFPHGAHTSIGLGSARKGFRQREALAALRRDAGLADAETVRREGAAIPMKPLRRWDDGVNVVLAGDAAGVVAPASGEGIYYAMLGGRLAGEAAGEFLRTGNARALREARRRFMRLHGQVFRVLGLMQRFWYANDDRRERFCAICRDPDVQRLTWTAYMRKELVRAHPAAHLRIFLKNVAHLTGLVSA